MPRFVAVADASDFPVNAGREFAIEGRIIAVFRVGDVFHALDGICPHAGGPLGNGALQGCIVTCPWHGWQFDVSTGVHCLNDRLRQTTYATRIVDGQLQIELP